MLPAVQTGDMDFATGHPLSLLVAVEQGLDMRIVSGWSHSLTEGQDINAVVVRADSELETWSYLEGQSVAVNVLNGQGDLTIIEAAQSEPEGTAETLSNFLDMDEEAAAPVNMEEFDGAIRREPLEDMGELMVDYGFIDEMPDLDTVIVDREDVE